MRERERQGTDSMSDDALRRPLPPSVFARLAQATRYAITGVSPDTWFGPLQPLAPMAPPEVKGRQFAIRLAPTSTISRAPRTASRSPNCAASPTRCRSCGRSSKPARTRSPARATLCERERAPTRRTCRRTSTPSRASSPALTGAIRSPTGSGCWSRRCWSSTRRPSIRATPEAAHSIRSTSSMAQRSSP